MASRRVIPVISSEALEAQSLPTISRNYMSRRPNFNRAPKGWGMDYCPESSELWRGPLLTRHLQGSLEALLQPWQKDLLLTPLRRRLLCFWMCAALLKRSCLWLSGLLMDIKRLFNPFWTVIAKFKSTRRTPEATHRDMTFSFLVAVWCHRELVR